MSEHLTRKLVQRYVDGELNSAAEAAVRAHLSGCVRCRRYAEGLRQTDALLRRMPCLSVPPEFAAHVMVRVRAQAAACPWTGRGARWFAWGTGLAGLVVLALTLTELLAGIPGRPGWAQLFGVIAAWPGQALQAPGTALAALGNVLAGVWQGVLALGETALPLGLALLALGGFIQMLRWLMWLGSSSDWILDIRD